MTDFTMPSLGADMEYGYLVEWFVQPGDEVSRGDIIADVETEKGVIAIECFLDGVVEEILIEAGREEVPVGTPLAVIRTAGEETEPARVVEAQAEVIEKREPVPAIAGAQRHDGILATPIARNVAMDLHLDLAKIEGSGPRGMITRHDVEVAAGQGNGAKGRTRVRISPAARRLADKLCVELDKVNGTGPNGAITLADVEQAAEKKQVSVTPVRTESAATDFAAGMRTAIAKAMAKSNREIPHYYLETTIDMSAATAWLERENLKRSIRDRIIMPVILLRAVARSLETVPQLNGFWVDDHLEPKEDIHIGFAIALRGSGLVTPALHYVNRKSPSELMTALSDLIKRTRAGKLRSSEMMDATITVTNLGDLGVETVFGVIYPPQVALVGLGKIVETPWAENGMLGIRPVLKATLAADHRATDGRIGGQFLDVLDKSLQEVETLWS